MRTLDSNALLEALLDTLPQLLYFKDASGRFTLVSRSMAHFHGVRDPDALVGKTDFHLHLEEFAQRYEREDRSIIETGQPLIDMEEQWIGADGQARWFLTTKVPVRNAANQVVGVAGSAQDITARKRIDVALRESEERFRCVFESGIIGIHFWDADGNVTHANDAYLQMVGYTREDLAARRVRWRDFTPPEFATQDDQALEQMQRFGVCPPFEKQYIRKDGKRMPILLGAALLPESDHEGVAFALDLTQRKQIEDALRESEQRFRGMAEHSNVGIWRITQTGHTLYANPAMCRMLEVDDHTQIQCTFHEFFTAETLALMQTEHAKRSAGLPSSYEAELVGRNGTLRHVLVSGSPLMNPDGTLGSLIGTFTDITDRKLAERELQKQRQEQQTILNSVPALIWYKDRENRIIRANKAAAASIGMTTAEVAGLSAYDLYPEQAEGYHRDDLDVINSGLPKMNIIEQLRVSSGQIRWLRTDKIPYRDEQGDIIGVIVFATDITELKAAEEALRREQQLMQIVMDNMPDAIYIKDRESRFLRTNIAHAKIMGLASAQEAIGWTDAKFFSPQDAAAFRADEMAVMDSGQSLVNRVEHHGGTTGEMRWWSTTKVPVRDDHGEIIGIAGITRDITPLKKASEEIRLLNEQLERRVADRTAKLETTNRKLEAEIAERRVAEERIRVYQQRLRSLASELALAEERERRRIAVDLHDQIGQTLALIQIKLTAMHDALVEQNITTRALKSELSACVELIRQPIHDSRSLVFNLSPPVLYDLGFEAAAAWLVDQHNGRMGLSVKFEDDEQPKPLEQAVAVLMFRAIRELLTNIVKHAGATQASVSLTRRKRQLCVEVKDNGKGFDAASLSTTAENGPEAGCLGFGIFSIREQFDRVGGTLHIKSSLGHGCHVVLTAPLKPAPTAAHRGLARDNEDHLS